MSKPVVLGVIAMAIVVVLSNILVQHLFGDWLTWGAFTYPIAFLVTDLTNRALGPAKARQVVFAGFIVGVICSLVASQMVSSEGFPLTTLRIAIGSGVAFLVAQMVDVFVFDKLRSGNWWRAPLTSSLIGSALDTALFFSIAFAAMFAFIDPADPNGWALDPVPLLGHGPVFPLWVSLAVADFGVKLALALIALAPFRALSAKMA
ncbi:MAG: queuosine precursor transporter [Pseudomonadota bacterium]